MRLIWKTFDQKTWIRSFQYYWKHLKSYYLNRKNRLLFYCYQTRCCFQTSFYIFEERCFCIKYGSWKYESKFLFCLHIRRDAIHQKEWNMKCLPSSLFILFLIFLSMHFCFRMRKLLPYWYTRGNDFRNGIFSINVKHLMWLALTMHQIFYVTLDCNMCLKVVTATKIRIF